jgi:adenosine/AMP kinase
VKNLDIITIKLEVPEDSNLILGQSHFIKTVEDLYEALAEASLASGPCLIRSSGNDQELESLAANMLLKIGAGHSFIIYLKNAFPVNVLKRVQSVSEVVRIFCATANPTQVLVAESDQGRGIIGVIDGFSPKGIETENDKEERKKFLRTIGYKPRYIKPLHI